MPEAEERSANVRITDIGWRPLLRTLVGVALLLLALTIVRQLGSLLETLVIATFLAIGLDAVARRVQRIGVGRGMSIAIVLGGAILASLLVVALLVPPLVRQAAGLVARAPYYVNDFEDSAAWEYLHRTFDLSNGVPDSIKDVLVKIPRAFASFVGSLVSGVFGLVTLVIAVAFLMVGGGQAIGLLVRLVPRLSTAGGWRVVIGAYTNIGRYIVGATLQAACAGVSLTIVLLVLDVPYALPLGVFMLLMDYIPLIGATIGAVPAVAVALFGGGMWQGVAVLLFLIVYQQIENTVIQPRIQGKVVHLPGIAIFFSVMVGGQLLGILGALIAVPVASIAAIIVNQYLQYTGRDQIVLPRLFDADGNPTAELLEGTARDADVGART